MDKKDTDLSFRFGEHTFEAEPKEFCKNIYHEANDRAQVLLSINVENQQFYEGIDKQLEQRAADPSVVRSSLFVPELTPAIDARVGEMVAKLNEDEFPVKERCLTDNPQDDEIRNLQWVENTLNEQLREAGYLTDVFTEQALAAEIYRSPSVVKVGWCEYTKKIPVVKRREIGMMEAIKSLMKLRTPPKEFEVIYEDKLYGRPYVEFVPPEELLYQPGKSLVSDLDYVIHAPKMTRAEIYASAKELDWNIKEIDAFFKERDSNDGTESNSASLQEEMQAAKDTPLPEESKVDKFLVTENYVVTYNANGERETHLCVLLALDKMLYNKRWGVKELRFPFVFLVANRQVGSLENWSSIDKGKGLQRLHSEGYNSMIDGVTYRNFPPFKNKSGNKFSESPVYGPGKIWNMMNPEDFNPVVQNPGPMPDLASLVDNASAKIRDILNSPAESEGVVAAQYEKAAKTKLRALGSSRRAAPVQKRYGTAVIEVANAFLALDRQYHEEGYRFVVNARTDVPALTNVYDPAEQKQEALLLYSTMREDPLFQTPAGKRKMRNAWEDVVRLFRKTAWDRISITEEELAQDMQDAVSMQNLIMQKQSMMADMASVTPSQKPEGKSNELSVQGG